MKINKSATSLAIAAAGIFCVAVPAVAAAASDSQVHCYGINSCKGHNDCQTAQNACRGHGACKGQGFVITSEKECTDQGGSVGK